MKNNNKTIILHCQKFRYRYQYNASGAVAPAIKEGIGHPWTITKQVYSETLDSETVGVAIYDEAVNQNIDCFDDVYKVTTHNGKEELAFTFKFCLDIAEAEAGQYIP